MFFKAQILSNKGFLPYFDLTESHINIFDITNKPLKRNLAIYYLAVLYKNKIKPLSSLLDV